MSDGDVGKEGCWLVAVVCLVGVFVFIVVKSVLARVFVVMSPLCCCRLERRV